MDRNGFKLSCIDASQSINSGVLDNFKHSQASWAISWGVYFLVVQLKKQKIKIIVSNLMNKNNLILSNIINLIKDYYQLTGCFSWASKYSLQAENCLEPKKPL